MINGLDEVEFPPIAFVDLDGVVFEEGTDVFVVGAVEKLKKLAQKYRIVLFSCGLSMKRLELIQKEGIVVLGLMQKPLGCEYCVVDDRLVLEDCGRMLW